MSFLVYILRCKEGSLYIGHTENIEQRVADHNAGRAALFTRNRRPVHVVRIETFKAELEAIHRERQLKKWSRKKKEALINGDLKGLHEAARRKQ